MQEVQETWVQSLGQKIPWSRKWQLVPVFLPGISHGQRSLVGYSPWGHKSQTQLCIWACRHEHLAVLLPGISFPHMSTSLVSTFQVFGNMTPLQCQLPRLPPLLSKITSCGSNLYPIPACSSSYLWLWLHFVFFSAYYYLTYYVT